MAWKRGAAIVLFVLGIVLLIPGGVILGLYDSSSSTATAHLISGAVLLGAGVICLICAIVICVKLPSSEKGVCNCFTMRSKNSADTRIPMEVTIHEKIYFGESDRKNLEKDSKSTEPVAPAGNKVNMNTNPSSGAVRGNRNSETAIPGVNSGVVAIFSDQEPDPVYSNPRKINRSTKSNTPSVQTTELPPGVRLGPGERVVSVTKTVQEPTVRRIGESGAPMILDARQLHQGGSHTVYLEDDLGPVTLPELPAPVVLAGPSGYQRQSSQLVERSVQHEMHPQMMRSTADSYRPREVVQQGGYRARGQQHQQMKEATVISETAATGIYDVPRSTPVATSEKERIARQLEGGLQHPPSYDETVYQDIRNIQ